MRIEPGLLAIMCRIMIGALVSLTINGVAGARQPDQILKIWPSVAPGSESWNHTERFFEIELDKGSGKKYGIYTNIVTPELSVFLPVGGRSSGSAVVICPGGSWSLLDWNAEGTDLAEWLADRGVTAFVLKYRVRPTPPDGSPISAKEQKIRNALGRNVAAYHAKVREYADLGAADGRRAIKLVRTRAGEWNIRADRIGMIGFSAGGDIVTNAVSAAEKSERPDFAALIYGAYLNDKPLPADAPPAFLVVGQQDKLSVSLEAKAYNDWISAGRSVEFHSFASGGHGFGMRKTGQSTDQWVSLFEAWLKHQGWITQVNDDAK